MRTAPPPPPRRPDRRARERAASLPTTLPTATRSIVHASVGRWRAAAALLVATLLAAAPAAAQGLADRVTETRLGNGLRVLLVAEDAAPVIAATVMFDVGGVDEPRGLGGIAHMVEHMAFKGTPTIGSFDPQAEARALAAVEVERLALAWARAEGDPAAAERARARFDAARERARQLAGTSPVDDLIGTNGGVGLNASTGYDSTSYVVSFPANRLELFARVYADALQNTTFRYFYSERDVVREERRSRNEDDPQGFLFEAFLAEAFRAHPYGRPLIGAPEEIADYTATAAEAFYRSFYFADRAVLVLVGDVDPERDLPLLERYFGTLPGGPDRRPDWPAEPPQDRERRFAVEYDAEPQLAIGYRKPTYPERDAYVLDLVAALLDSGRTSRLYQRLVLGDGSALDVSASSAFPGTRYPNLFLIYALPRAPFGPDDLEAAIDDELARLAREPVDERELQKIKNQVRASLLRGLASPSGLGRNLAYNELFAGGWERFEEDLAIYESITAEEIRAVAARTFTPESRTVGVLRRADEPGGEGDEGSAR